MEKRDILNDQLAIGNGFDAFLDESWELKKEEYVTTSLAIVVENLEKYYGKDFFKEASLKEIAPVLELLGGLYQEQYNKMFNGKGNQEESIFLQNLTDTLLPSVEKESSGTLSEDTQGAIGNVLET